MRFDGTPPRTWLLATVAGWTLAVWALGLMGMGGHLQPLPDDPAMAMHLPQLPPPPAERLGPLAQYAEISARPVFSEDRRPQPFSLAPEGDAAAPQAFDFVLTSVLITPTLRMAIVQPAAGGESIRIKLGSAAEEQPAWRLTALNPRSAVFEGPEGQKTLDLRVYNGTGGQPPTALHTVPVAGVGDGSVSPAVKPTPPPPPPTATTRPPSPEQKPAVKPPAAPPPTPNPTADAAATPDAQVESIRKRIEERRTQLRREAQNPVAPVKNP